jgi:hypothetical protein
VKGKLMKKVHRTRVGFKSVAEKPQNTTLYENKLPRMPQMDWIKDHSAGTS